MNKVRIVKREYVQHVTTYVIQKKHWIFRWWWVDGDSDCERWGNDDTWPSLAQAEKNVWRYDGTPYYTDKVVKTYEN